MHRDEQLYNGRLIKLYRQKKTMPNGYNATLEVVKHPGAALIVPFIDKNRIVFIKQYRPVIDSYIYELPAGTLAEKESPLACAKREIIEEISYKACRIKRLGYIYPAPGYTTEKIYIFRADGLVRVDASPEEDEVISLEIMNRTQYLKLFNNGKIVDAKTIAALAFCGWA